MRYIRISPVDAFFYDFMETPNGQYTAVKFWHDLSSLNGITHKNLKIFVTHDTSHAVISEPIMFVVALTEADSIINAIPELVDSIRNLLGTLSSHFNCSFSALHERSFTVAATAAHDFSIKDLDVEISKGVISSFIVINPNTVEEVDDGYEFKRTKTKLTNAVKGSVKHDEYIDSYFSVNHPDASSLHIKCEMVQPEKFQSIGGLPDFESGHVFNTLLNLYNESLACSVPSSAFSLLWQLIEIIESNAAATPIFNDDTLKKIAISLGEHNIDADLIQNRILGNLKAMKLESQPDRFILGAKRLFPNWTAPDDVRHIFRNARKVRGKIYHPRSASDPYDKELLQAHLAIKRMVKSFIKAIVEESSNKAIQPTTESGG